MHAQHYRHAASADKEAAAVRGAVLAIDKFANQRIARIHNVVWHVVDITLQRLAKQEDVVN